MAEEEPPMVEDMNIPEGGNYAINLINRVQNDIFNAEEYTYELPFNGDVAVTSVSPFLQAVADVLANITAQHQDHDRIQLTIHSDDNGFQRPIVLPLSQVIDFDIESITDELKRNLNSNETYSKCTYNDCDCKKYL